MMIIELALCMLLQQPPDQKDNKELSLPFEKDPWAGLKVGSWVKIKTVSPGASEEVKLTLSEITDSGKRILRDPPREVKEGQDDGTWSTFVPFTKILLGLGLKVRNRKEEAHRIGGKTRVEEYAHDNLLLSLAARCRVWLSDQVPGGVAKVVVEVEGENRDKTTCEAVALEKLKVGGKDLVCVRFRYERTWGKDQKIEASYWLSPDVPGLLVKAQSKTTSGKLSSESSLTVTDFEASK